VKEIYEAPVRLIDSERRVRCLEYPVFSLDDDGLLCKGGADIVPMSQFCEVSGGGVARTRTTSDQSEIHFGSVR